MKKIFTLFAVAMIAISSVFAQGKETFDNSKAGTAYETASFVGNDGITWTYVASRDANNDANNSGIDLPALMLRREADDSKVTSSTISGGVASVTMKLYKGFTGDGDRIVELYINGDLKGTSEGFDDLDEHTFTVEDINVEGDFTIEVRNKTSKQVIVDDIEWTAAGTLPAVEKPTFSQEAGRYAEAFDLTIETATEGAEIFYTLDETTPTAESTKYTAAINISEDVTVKAIAVKDEDVSTVASIEYQIGAAPSTNVATIAEFMEREDVETELTIDGALTVIYQNYLSLYVEENGVVYLLFGDAVKNQSPELVNGQVLTGVSGTYKFYNGAGQVNATSLGTVSEGTEVEPLAIAVDDITVEHANQYIEVLGAEFAADVTYESGQTTNGAIVNGEGEMTVRTNFRVIDGSYKAGDKVNIIGFVSVYNNNPQIYPISIEKASTVGVENNVENAAVVYSNNSEIFVQATEGANIKVYTIDGSCIYDVVAVSANTVIADMPQSVLVVTVDGKAVKVMNK